MGPDLEDDLAYSVELKALVDSGSDENVMGKLDADQQVALGNAKLVRRKGSRSVRLADGTSVMEVGAYNVVTQVAFHDLQQNRWVPTEAQFAVSDLTADGDLILSWAFVKERTNLMRLCCDDKVELAQVPETRCAAAGGGADPVQGGAATDHEADDPGEMRHR